jgi:[acyl-carrier-protein] S-malonyltransferase
VPNTLARPVVDASEIRKALESQISTPVKWQQSIEQMIGLGINTFIEVGPGKVLSRLVKRIDKSAEVMSTDNPDELNKTLAYLDKM